MQNLLIRSIDLKTKLITTVFDNAMKNPSLDIENIWCD